MSIRRRSAEVQQDADGRTEMPTDAEDYTGLAETL